MWDIAKSTLLDKSIITMNNANLSYDYNRKYECSTNRLCFTLRMNE